jgi:hypothetical protein
MKTQTKILTTLSQDQVKELTTQVNETLATDFIIHSKTFTAADLWNIRRRMKSIAIR